MSKKIKNCQQNCQNVGQVMFPHHSDQMSQRSQVSKGHSVMSKVKVSQSVSQWQGHLLSCCGQLKTTLFVLSLSWRLNCDVSVVTKSSLTQKLCRRGANLEEMERWNWTSTWRYPGINTSINTSYCPKYPGTNIQYSIYCPKYSRTQVSILHIYCPKYQ